MALKPHNRAGSCGLPAMVGLLCTHGNHGFAPFCDSVSNQILQFSGFVASRCQTRLVVAFDIQIVGLKQSRDVLQLVQGRGEES